MRTEGGSKEGGRKGGRKERVLGIATERILVVDGGWREGKGVAGGGGGGGRAEARQRNSDGGQGPVG